MRYVINYIMEFDTTAKTLLRKMVMHNVCGGKHHGLDDLKHGFPSHEKGNVEKAVKKLVKANYILKHPAHYGYQYSVNHDMIDEIQKILEE